MGKNIIHLEALPTYTPPGHSWTINRRLLGPGVFWSDRMEVVHGQIEYGGQADPHAHPDHEQAFFVLEGRASVEINGVSEDVGPNHFIYLPPGTLHRVTALEGPPLKLLIIYAPPLSSNLRE